MLAASKNVRDDHDDWPLDGVEIALDIHDLPHKSSNIEWWYCNGHLTGSNDDQYAVFACFFRVVDEYRSTPDQIFYLHALTWSIIDLGNREYYASSTLDRAFIARILNGPELVHELDKHLLVAYREMLNKNQIPLPDRLCQSECRVNLNQLDLNYDGNQFYKDEHGNYHLSCHDATRKIGLDLEMQPLKPACKQAHDGIVKVGLNQAPMFYYFIPRLRCRGQLRINHQSIPVSGQTWYDHEFGGVVQYKTKSELAVVSTQRTDYAWYWFSIQLDNHYDLTVTHLVDAHDHSTIDKSVLIIGPNNERIEIDNEGDIELIPLNSWLSARTACAYPTHWKLKVSKINCELFLNAAFDQQEFITVLSRPAFWEGRMDVHGRIGDRPVQGHAFFECHGSNMMVLKSLDFFFRRISQIVLTNIERILPRQPTFDQALNLIANRENASLLAAIDLDIVSKTIIAPLRDIIDRGGKAWRSFLCLVCVDCVGGDSRKYEHWSALAEILHVGSLIIDDIQDQSDLRRGGPACHVLHGVAQAINAGTAAYFLPLHTLIERTPHLTSDLKLQIYERTFLTLRAAHVGQGLDIHGLDYLMDEAVETGDSGPLEEAILCIHRLKSGVPAGNLARMGAIIGGATNEQAVALENYAQSIGAAFQIIDDVLNLRGFENNSKQRGEDITAGKITFPIAKAMSARFLKTQRQRQDVWNVIRSKTTDAAIINELIELLENCGCVHESVVQTRTLVEDAWTSLEPFILDSFDKLILRAFGLYILERHY